MWRSCESILQMESETWKEANDALRVKLDEETEAQWKSCSTLRAEVSAAEGRLSRLSSMQEPDPLEAELAQLSATLLRERTEYDMYRQAPSDNATLGPRAPYGSGPGPGPAVGARPIISLGIHSL